MDECHYTFIWTHRMYNAKGDNINCLLGVIMIIICSSIVKNVPSGERYCSEERLEMCGGGEYMGNLCTFSSILL